MKEREERLRPMGQLHGSYQSAAPPPPPPASTVLAANNNSTNNISVAAAAAAAAAVSNSNGTLNGAVRKFLVINSIVNLRSNVL